MKITSAWLGWALAVILGLFCGCAEAPDSPPSPPMTQGGAAPLRIRYLRATPMPPVHSVLLDKDEPAPEGRYVLVDSPPPEPKPEAMPPRGPGSHQVWLPGHWRYYAGRYVWIGGHYEPPPQIPAHYVPAHWETRGQAYWFVEGYWRAI